MKGLWGEQVRKKAKAIRLQSRNLIYHCLTKRWQPGSPLGHAPRRFADNAADYATANPGRAAWIPVIPSQLLKQPLPEASPLIEAHFKPFLQTQLPAEGVLRLEGGRVLGGYAGAVVTVDGTLMKSLSTDPFGLGRHRSSVRLRLPKIQKLPGRTAFLATPEANQNYYHFTVDLLPRLLLLEKALGSLDGLDQLVLNLGGQNYESELLTCFGVHMDRVVRLGENTHLETEELLVPTWTPSEYGVANWKITGIRSKMSLGKIGEQPEKRLFLSRKNAAFRRLENEDELVEALQCLGFSVVDCGALSLQEQVALFSSASQIVGLHGAAFTNIIYCMAGTEIFEIVNESSPRGFFWSIGCAGHLQHHFIPAIPTLSANDLENHRVNRVNCTVDIPKLISAILSRTDRGNQRH